MSRDVTTREYLASVASAAASGAARVGVYAVAGLAGGVATTVQAALSDLQQNKVGASRAITTSGGLQGGGDLSSDRTHSLTDTSVAPGTYTIPTITVDQKGRLTSAASGTPGSIPDASTTTKGATKLSAAPVSATEPIAVGDNDARVPTTGENDALQGTSGTPSNTNRYVTNQDSRLVTYEKATFSFDGALSSTKTGANRARVTLPGGVSSATIASVTAQLGTPSSSGSVTVDVNRAASGSLATLTTLYTTQATRPSIAANARDVNATLPDVTTLNSGDHLTVDIDAIGTSASNLVVEVRYYY